MKPPAESRLTPTWHLIPDAGTFETTMKRLHAHLLFTNILKYTLSLVQAGETLIHR